MIDHVKLLIVLSNLLLGTAVAMYIHYMYRRFDFAPLKPIFYHAIFNNLLVFLLLAMKYYDVNIGEEIFRISDTVDSVLRSFFLYLFFIGFSYASLGAYLAFLKICISPAIRRGLEIATIVLLAGVFLELLFAEGSLAAQVHYQIYENAGAVFILLEIVIMIIMPFKAGKLKDKERVKLVRAFSLLYICRYPAVLLMVIIPQPFRLLLALLMLNAVPYIWCRYFMLPFVKRSTPQAVKKMDLSDVAAQYRLSPREAEILGLIMEGKSNRNMEESLFISYHTVKNHVYNLYRKLGVKTRFELLHMMSNVVE